MTCDRLTESNDTTPSVGSVTSDGNIVTTTSNSFHSCVNNIICRLWAFDVTVILVLLMMVLAHTTGNIITHTLTNFGVMMSPFSRAVFGVLITQVLAMGSISIIYVWAVGYDITDLNIKHVTLIDTVRITGIVSSIIIFNASIVILGSIFNVTLASNTATTFTTVTIVTNFIHSTTALYIAFIPLMILIVGPFEELFFRGVIQTRLAQTYTSGTSIVLTNILFFTVHIPTYNLTIQTPTSTFTLIFAAIFITSTILGHVYHETQNLTLVGLAHGIYNSAILFETAFNVW